jgi:hypothetical protein
MPRVKLENKTARILHISLGGGKNVAVPPAEGGIKVKFSDSEKEAFDKNVATPEVQGWIDAGDLVIEELEEGLEAEETEDLEAEEEGDER